MKRKILIPTDFTIESLMLLKHAAMHSTEKLDVVLMYAYELSDSITDLLFYSPIKVLKPLVTADFKEACNILRNKYTSNIHSINIEVFHGNSSAFEKFIEVHQIKESFIPKTYVLKTDDNSFDPIPLIRKSKLIVQEVEWDTQRNVPEKGTLAELFLS